MNSFANQNLPFLLELMIQNKILKSIIIFISGNVNNCYLLSYLIRTMLKNSKVK